MVRYLKAKIVLLLASFLGLIAISSCNIGDRPPLQDSTVDTVINTSPAKINR